MQFKAPKCDQDIIQQMRDDYHVIDPNPTAGERKGWNLRPRDRDREIGPQFRFHHRVGL